MSREAWGDENPDDADYYSWSERASDAGWINPEDYSPGAIAILQERERQEVEEGWTPAHDNKHASGELADAAACYALQGSRAPRGYFTLENFWPWSCYWWKPSDRRRDLVKAGALIAAEIDRLDRAAHIADTTAPLQEGGDA